MFDHQISRFEKRIADLPDQPTLAPDALKAWFDSAPEQLRQALNQVCADGKTLEERMESLVIGAYGGTVTREMLAQELQQEIAGKAEQSAVQASLSALSGSFTDMTFEGAVMSTEIFSLAFGATCAEVACL